MYEKSSDPIDVPSNIALPKGKWARDVDSDTAVIKPFFGKFYLFDLRFFKLYTKYCLANLKEYCTNFVLDSRNFILRINLYFCGLAI